MTHRASWRVYVRVRRPQPGLRRSSLGEEGARGEERKERSTDHMHFSSLFDVGLGSAYARLFDKLK